MSHVHTVGAGFHIDSDLNCSNKDDYNQNWEATKRQDGSETKATDLVESSQNRLSNSNGGALQGTYHGHWRSTECTTDDRLGDNSTPVLQDRHSHPRGSCVGENSSPSLIP